MPEYLGGLRSRGAQPLVPGGHELLASLRGDLHSHSDWSDGGSPIEAMVGAARLLGREYLALTDHSPNLKIANGLSAERLAEQLDIVEEINADDGGFRLLRGIEVDILEDGTLDQTPEMLDRLDIVVASVHSKLRADKRTMTRRMLGAIADPHTNVLGHCTGRLVQGGRGTRPASEFDAEEVFAACAENNVAVEINSRPERQDPPGALIRDGPRRRLPVQHQQRCPRPGPARFPAVRCRAGGTQRRAGGADRHHLAPGPPAGMGGLGALTAGAHARPRDMPSGCAEGWT